MSDGSWTCPDCAEQVATGAFTCPYCGYGAAAAAAARWGYCPICGQSEWEGAAGRCAVCGASLVNAALSTQAEAIHESVTTVESAPAVAPAPEAADSPGDRQPTATVASGHPAPGAGGDPSPSAGDDGIVLLRELAGLRNEGVITSEEFDSKKAEILRRL